MKQLGLLRAGGTAAMVLGLLASGARATWSIAIADHRTQEVAVGTVTCIANYNLLRTVPVIVVGKGAAAVQASGDSNGIRKPIIFDNLILGTDPQDILDLLAEVTGHQSRQYGLADTQGRTLTFTGSQCFDWAGGVVGSSGSMVYAIQGNILVGDCVVAAIEDALVNTDGDIPARLMAGMEAARATGGDGRCSCLTGGATSCGCPVQLFRKSGHVGGMVVARTGDLDDPACDAGGCVDGDYFMRFNVALQPATADDPVHQLQEMYDTWRAELVGRPDAIQSTVEFDPPALPPTGAPTVTMTITLRDWRGERISVPIESVLVSHAPGNAGTATIGELADHGGGVYSVVITGGTQVGNDRFAVVVDDGIRPVHLMPYPSPQYFNFGDCDGDGDVDLGDFAEFGLCFAGADTGLAHPSCACFDSDGDEDTDLTDFVAFQESLAGVTAP